MTKRIVLCLGAPLVFHACATAKPELAQAPAGAQMVQPEAPTPWDGNTRTVAVGTIDVLEFDVPIAPNPSAGNRSVLEAQPGTAPSQLRVIPLRKGTSSLTVTDQQGKTLRKITYNVITNDLSAKVQAIRSLLWPVKGISIEAVDDKIVLDGALTNPESVLKDFDRILQVQEAYKDVVFNLVTLSPKLFEAARAQMEERIRRVVPGAGGVTVEWVNGTYVLQGRVDTLYQRDRAEMEVTHLLPPMMGSSAIRENVIMLGAKKFSIRNLIEVAGERSPASACPPAEHRYSGDLNKNYRAFYLLPLFPRGF